MNAFTNFIREQSTHARRRSRRHWTAEEKRSIVQQALDGRDSVSDVARQHGIAVSLLFKWRKQLRDGTLVQAAPEASPVELQTVQAEIAQLREMVRSMGEENRRLLSSIEHRLLVAPDARSASTLQVAAVG